MLRLKGCICLPDLPKSTSSLVLQLRYFLQNFKALKFDFQIQGLSRRLLSLIKTSYY